MYSGNAGYLSLSHHFLGKPMVASQNGSCYLRLQLTLLEVLKVTNCYQHLFRWGGGGGGNVCAPPYLQKFADFLELYI